MSIPLVFACFLRLNGFIILLAVLLSIVFKKEKIKKAKMMEMVFLCIIVFFIPTGVKKTIDMFICAGCAAILSGIESSIYRT